MEHYTDDSDYTIIIKQDEDVDAKLEGFFACVPVVGDRTVVSAQIKKQVGIQREALQKDSTDDPHIVGKSVTIKHYVVPALNNGREFFIYLVHVFA